MGKSLCLFSWFCIDGVLVLFKSVTSGTFDIRFLRIDKGMNWFYKTPVTLLIFIIFLYFSSRLLILFMCLGAPVPSPGRSIGNEYPFEYCHVCLSSSGGWWYWICSSFDQEFTFWWSDQVYFVVTQNLVTFSIPLISISA